MVLCFVVGFFCGILSLWVLAMAHKSKASLKIMKEIAGSPELEALKVKHAERAAVIDAEEQVTAKDQCAAILRELDQKVGRDEFIIVCHRDCNSHCATMLRAKGFTLEYMVAGYYIRGWAK